MEKKEDSSFYMEITIEINSLEKSKNKTKKQQISKQNSRTNKLPRIEAKLYNEGGKL